MILDILFTASYDGMASIPTTDLPMDPRHSQESMLPSAARPQPHSQQPVMPQEDLFISPASHQVSSLRFGWMRMFNAICVHARARVCVCVLIVHLSLVGNSGRLTWARLRQRQGQRYPFLRPCAVFVCVQIVVWLPQCQCLGAHRC